MPDWTNIIAEFEDMARRVKALAEDREDVELGYLSERLLQRAADIRRDCYVDQFSSSHVVS